MFSSTSNFDHGILGIGGDRFRLVRIGLLHSYASDHVMMSSRAPSRTMTITADMRISQVPTMFVCGNLRCNVQNVWWSVMKVFYSRPKCPSKTDALWLVHSGVEVEDDILSLLTSTPLWTRLSSVFSSKRLQTKTKSNNIQCDMIYGPLIIPWAVLDMWVGRFECTCSCGPFRILPSAVLV